MLQRSIPPAMLAQFETPWFRSQAATFHAAYSVMTDGNQERLVRLSLQPADRFRYRESMGTVAQIV